MQDADYHARETWQISSLLFLAVTLGFVFYRYSDFYVWNDPPSAMVHAAEAETAVPSTLTATTDAKDAPGDSRNNASAAGTPRDAAANAGLRTAAGDDSATVGSTPKPGPPPRSMEGWSSTKSVVQTRMERWNREPIAVILEALHYSFGFIGHNGYRPISSLQSMLALVFLGIPGPTFGHLAVWGLGYGLAAVALFNVSLRFVRTRWAGIWVVVLFFATAPAVAASWVIVAGFQMLVPLVMCSALLAYWSAIENSSREQQQRNTGRPIDRIAGLPYSTWSMIGLISLLIVGPWIREFVGLTNFLICAAEFQRRGRPTPIMFLCGILFCHAVYPTAIMHFTLYPELPLLPVNKLGLLGTQLQQQDLVWDASWHFLPMLPPSLLVIAAACSCGLGIRDLIRLWPLSRETPAQGIDSFARSGSLANPHTNPDQPETLTHALMLVARQAGYVLAAALPIAWVAVTQTLFERNIALETIGLMLSLLPAVIALRTQLLLTGWFLLTFLPILRVFAEHVHFLYCLVPCTIAVVAVIEEAWIVLTNSKTSLRGVRWLIASACVALTIGHVGTLFATSRVMFAHSAGVRAAAKKISESVPKGSIVLCNVVLGAEIQWELDSSVQILPTLTAGVIDPGSAITTVEQLKTLAAGIDSKPLYFLDCHHAYLPTKSAYHHHWCVHDIELPVTDLGEIHTVRERYSHIDPLLPLVVRPCIPFLGPPDLVNDYYTGPASKSAWNSYECQLSYHLYRVDGKVLGPKASDDGHLEMAEEGRHGFNILKQQQAWLALPQSGGAFNAARFRNHEYTQQFSGFSLEEVQKAVDQFAEQNPQVLAKWSRPTPVLEDEGFLGFNVIRLGDTFYGIRQDDGGLEESRIAANDYKELFKGASLDAVRDQISAAGETPIPPSPVPLLLVANYNDFNILQYQGTLYGVACTEGEFTTEKLAAGKYARIVDGRTIAEVKRKIDQMVYAVDTPERR